MKDNVTVALTQTQNSWKVVPSIRKLTTFCAESRVWVLGFTAVRLVVRTTMPSLRNWLLNDQAVVAAAGACDPLKLTVIFIGSKVVVDNRDCRKPNNVVIIV